MAHQSIIDKTSRIVFVNNLPPEATEDKLKELFRRVGSVVSFKIIYDKETGRSKGCGYCEYKDQDTALNSVRSLNNVDLGGRSLKVDHALNEKSRLEMISALQGTPSNDASSSEKAPETISKAVASLPPEQMFELLKQMKQCVQNNPGEAKNMLLQNPQLAYALLQALVVMRIVDPQIAFTALNNSSATNTLASTISSAEIPVSNFSASSMINRAAATASEIKPVPKTTAPVSITSPSSISSRSYTAQPTPPPAPSIPLTVVPPPPPTVHDVDLRTKLIPSQDKAKTFGVETSKRDPRLQHQTDSKDSKTGILPRMVPPPTVPAAPQVSHPPTPNAPSITSNDARPAVPAISAPSATSSQPGTAKPATTSTPDNEKAALIMQVLRLTDAQIAMLPPEQQQSILLLKEQIAKSTKR